MNNSVKKSEEGPRYVHVRSSSLESLEKNVNAYMSEDPSWTPAAGVQVITVSTSTQDYPLYLQVLYKRQDIQVIANSFNAIGYDESNIIEHLRLMRGLSDV